MHGKNKSRFGAQEAAEFNFGYLYRSVEEQLNRFATTEGNPYSITDIALRVSGLLRDKALRESLGHTEPLQEMRRGTAKERAAGAKKDVDVVPRSHRTLSKDARRRIGAAQRKRWRLQKRAGKKKRPLSTGQLAAMRANIAKGRAAHLEKLRRAA